MVAERDGPSFAAQAGDLRREIAAAAREWRERCQNAFGGTGTEETLLDTDTFLSAVERADDRWRRLAPPADQAEAYTTIAGTINDLRIRLDELVSALEVREPERVRVASQAAVLSLDELEALLTAQ